MADNLAFFPYQSQAEPLFVIHHIDLLISVNGSTRLQAVREAFFPELKELLALQAALSNSNGESSTSATNNISSPGFAVCDIIEHPDPHSNQQTAEVQEALTRLELEEEKEDVLIKRVMSASAEQISQIRESIRASRTCLVLLNLKQYLKDVYGMTDSKIQKFSPSDPNKNWDKQLSRKSGARFTPDLCLRSAIEELESEENANSQNNGEFLLYVSIFPLSNVRMFPLKVNLSFAFTVAVTVTEDMAKDLVQEFFEFRKLILSIDPPDEDALDGTLPTSDDPAGQANPTEGKFAIL